MKNLILFLTLLTGFSGLVFQVVWQKYFSYLLGGEALSSALVVSVFLGGLSFGYWLFGQIANGKSAKTLLMAAGLAEIGIGVCALVFPFAFQLAWGNLESLPHAQPWNLLVDIALTILLICPSTILMGSTLPLLTRGLAADKKDLSGIHAKVYGLNTLGAFLGAIVSGFFLIRTFGLAGTLTRLSLINIVAGSVMVFFSRRAPMEVLHAEEKRLPTAPLPVYVLILSLLTGFVSVGFEIILIRSVNLAIGTSEYTYSLIVGVFIAMIALGTFSLRWLKNKNVNALLRNQLALVVGLLLLYLSVPYWGWLGYVVGESLPRNFYIYNTCIFILFSALVAMPVFFMGRNMPLLFSLLDTRMDRAAISVGRIYAANTIGCCLGGMTLGYILFLYFDADIIFRIGILLSCAACFVTVFQLQVKRFAMALVTGLSVLAFVLPTWSPGLMTAGLFRAHRHLPVAFSDPLLFFQAVEQAKQVLLYRDDPNMNVSVVEWPTHERSLYVNGKSDGSTSNTDLLTTMMLGHLPALFTRASGRTAVVGLGLGTTAHALTEYPDVNAVDVFEIASAVIEAQPLFNAVNGTILNEPRVHIHHMDAFSGLLTSEESFAAITAESSNPWVAGSDRLYSTEFYQAVAKKLKTGGVFAQWMHTYEMSLSTFGMVMNTFRTAFPHVQIFSHATDIVMLGSDQPFGDDTWKLAAQRWSVAQKDMDQVGIHSLTDLALHEVYYPEELSKHAEVHSLFSPKLAFAAGQDFYFVRNFDLTEVMATDPEFAHAYRSAWPTSFIGRAEHAESNYPLSVVNSCADVKEGVVTLNFATQSPSCKTRFLDLAVKNKLPPQPELAAAVALLTQFAKGEALKTKLTALEQIAVLDLYPPSLPAPKVDYLNELRTTCSGDRNCENGVARAKARFGYDADTRAPAQVE